VLIGALMAADPALVGPAVDALARRSLYLQQLEDTETIFDVSARIKAFRKTLSPRPHMPIPH